ncbi:MAG: 4-hydroxy-tetrahydrodipicolinate reductase [Gemmatimonadota bacterium]
MRLALVGYGRMGRAVEAEAQARGHEIHTIIDPGPVDPARVRGADVAIEFTTPEAAPDNIVALTRAGVPVVCGTTGWYARLPDVTAAVEQQSGALLYAPNFSIGVQVFLRTARELARGLAGRPGFDAFIVESHHARKLDAPSGTALALQRAAQAGDPERPFPITSIRAGAIPGTHAITWDGPQESITLEHVARGREIFASGAVLAAEWLVGRRGVFTFEQMLFGGEG